MAVTMVGWWECSDTHPNDAAWGELAPGGSMVYLALCLIKEPRLSLFSAFLSSRVMTYGNGRRSSICKSRPKTSSSQRSERASVWNDMLKILKSYGCFGCRTCSFTSKLLAFFPKATEIPKLKHCLCRCYKTSRTN